jgi:hypothetical protein
MRTLRCAVHPTAKGIRNDPLAQRSIHHIEDAKGEAADRKHGTDEDHRACQTDPKLSQGR